MRGLDESLINDYDYFRIDIDSNEINNEIFDKWNVYPNVVKTIRKDTRLSKTTSVEEELVEYIDISNTSLDKSKLLDLGRKFISGE